MKNRTLYSIIVVFFLTTVPLWAAAGGAESEGADPSWGWLVPAGRWLNLALLVWVIYYFLHKPLGKYFRERRDRIHSDLVIAAEEYEEASQLLEEAEKQVRRIEDELQRVRREAEKEAEKERQRIREQAERDAEKIVEGARREIDGLTRSAQKQLRDYAAQLAVELAEERIRRDMSEQDEARVIERFLTRLVHETGTAPK